MNGYSYHPYTVYSMLRALPATGEIVFLTSDVPPVYGVTSALFYPIRGQYSRYLQQTGFVAKQV